MSEDNEMKYVNVPTYIEKSVKKLFKLENTKRELVAQIKDYMVTHDIPTDTPLSKTTILSAFIIVPIHSKR